MSHHCQALVIHCMDFRFHSAIRDFLVSMRLKDQYDLVSLAGAAKGLLENDRAGSEVILKQIDISQRLHGISEVYIIHHMDCGAYGGHAAFADLSAEHAKQAADLKAAQRIVSEKFTSLTVKKVLARIEERDGRNLIDFEVISN